MLHWCSLPPCPDHTLLIPAQSKTWSEITPSGRLPPPRHSHSITFYKDHLFLFGGLDELGAQSFAM